MDKIKNLTKNKKIMIIAVLFAILVLLVVANIINMKKKEEPIPTPAPGQTYYYQNLIPGVATKEDVINTLGTPIKSNVVEENEVLYFKSDVEDRPHQAYINENRMVLFKEVVRWNKNIYDIQKILGNPKNILFTSDIPGSFQVYIYPNSGVAYISHPKTTSITDIWYFSPISFEEFKSSWGKNFYENVITDPSQIPPGRR